jgi:SAM-dependent methyltransferase
MRPSGLSANFSAGLQHACPHCRSAIELTESGASCASCGFQVTRTKGVYRFLEQAETINEWQSKFEELASGPLGNTSLASDYLLPVQLRYIVAAVRRVCGTIPVGARVLDVGCGNGIFSELLLNGGPAIGVDYSLSMCILARARNLTAYQANALALPFADAQFDLVYSAEMLQLIDDLPAALTEFARVCRPGGAVVVSTSNAASLLRRVFQTIRKFYPVRMATPPPIKRTAEEINLAANGLPLTLKIACWTHFPFPWLRCGLSARSALAWTGTNVVVRFVKQPAN